MSAPPMTIDRRVTIYAMTDLLFALSLFRLHCNRHDSNWKRETITR